MLSWMQAYLAQRGDANPLISARWLISDAVDMSYMDLYLNLERPLSARELECLHNYVERRAQGEPLQYITGKTTFRYIDLDIGDHVLIPRPETEVLVSEVLELFPKQKYNVFEGYGQESDTDDAEILMADLCTGSGCVACSLAFENPHIKVIATDISPECVALAQANAEKLGLEQRIEVIECDLGDGIEPALMNTFDAVVSNPPYIPTAELSTLPGEVITFEPSLALDGGADGLDVFRRLVVWAHDALKQGGLLACELHETTLDQAATIANAAGFAHVRIVEDLAGKPRVLLARKEGI